MANNAGRQAGGGNGQMNEHVEFTVKVSICLIGDGVESQVSCTIIPRSPVEFEKLRRSKKNWCFVCCQSVVVVLVL